MILVLDKTLYYVKLNVRSQKKMIHSQKYW